MESKSHAKQKSRMNYQLATDTKGISTMQLSFYALNFWKVAILIRKKIISITNATEN